MAQPSSKRLVTEDVFTTGQATKQAAQKVAASVSANGAAVVNKHNPVDASGGVRAISLPTGQAEGTQVSIEKTDSSTNVVNITGNIRGSAGQTVALAWQNETLVVRADSAGSWWPFAGHKTKSAIDAAITTATRTSFIVVNYGSGTVPLRNTVTTDTTRPVWWMGTTPPPTTTGYALSIDVFGSTA